MSDSDQPPEEIWLDDEALNAHFEQVRARYASKSNSETWEPVPDLDQNELTAAIRGR